MDFKFVIAVWSYTFYMKFEKMFDILELRPIIYKESRERIRALLTAIFLPFVDRIQPMSLMRELSTAGHHWGIN